MKYLKPKCDCGADLIYVCEVMYEETQKIKKDGTLAKIISKCSTGVSGAEFLECIKCDNEYCVDILHGIIIRGELR
jgi:hypothetical protein